MIKKGGQIVFEEREDMLLIRVGGEIDHHSAVGARTEIDEKILSVRPSRVLLELSAVEFMDSSGLGLIMGRLSLVKQYGGTLCVLDPSPAVIKIMRLAGMERLVTVLRTKQKRKEEES